ncbi:MAG TPA: hypothetical protein VLK58_02330 [Conexibacter sp.]|nr:hypothetical protein [Conexibacter sp.]
MIDGDGRQLTVRIREQAYDAPVSDGVRHHSRDALSIDAISRTHPSSLSLDRPGERVRASLGKNRKQMHICVTTVSALHCTKNRNSEFL